MSEALEQKPSKAYYPLFVSLTGRVCLVVGGGAVGERKVRGLLRAGAEVRIAARELTEWLRIQCRAGTVEHVGSTFDHGMLDGVDLVFAATSDPALNRDITEAARARRLWCNSASDPMEGSFVLPAVLRKGQLTVAVGTSGASPAMARLIRDRLAEDFDDAWLIVLEMMTILRGVVQSRGLDTWENQKLFRQLANLPLLDWVRSRERDALVEAVRGTCHPHLGLDEMNRIWDEAWKAFSS